MKSLDFPSGAVCGEIVADFSLCHLKTNLKAIQSQVQLVLMTSPSSFHYNPYEGQIFYDPDTDRTFECKFRDPLDRMINKHLAHYVWCDITEEC